MPAKSRFANTFTQKMILWVVALLCAWELLQKQTVTDAILAFCCAGVVPGTGLVLSPDTVVRIATGALVAGGLALCIKPVLRIVKRRRLSSTATAVAVVLATESAPISSPDPTTPSKAETAAPRPSQPASKFNLHIALHLPRWAQMVVGAQTGLARRVRPTALLVAQLLDRAARRCVKVCGIGVAVGRTTAVRSAKFTAAKSVAFWRCADPHFRQFDAWLERQAQAFQKRLAKKAAAHEDALFVLNIIRECMQLLMRLQSMAFANRSKAVKNTSDET